MIGFSEKGNAGPVVKYSVEQAPLTCEDGPAGFLIGTDHMLKPTEHPSQIIVKKDKHTYFCSVDIKALIKDCLLLDNHAYYLCDEIDNEYVNWRIIKH